MKSDVESLVIQPNVYYTVEEAAKLLRISRAAMLRLLQSGQPRGVKIGKQWRILGAALFAVSTQGEESEATHVADWLAASTGSLTELWDNAEDAAYDQEDPRR